jgi:hypothetical protein
MSKKCVIYTPYRLRNDVGILEEADEIIIKGSESFGDLIENDDMKLIFNLIKLFGAREICFRNCSFLSIFVLDAPVTLRYVKFYECLQVDCVLYSFTNQRARVSNITFTAMTGMTPVYTYMMTALRGNPQIREMNCLRCDFDQNIDNEVFQKCISYVRRNKRGYEKCLQVCTIILALKKKLKKLQEHDSAMIVHLCKIIWNSRYNIAWYRDQL